MPADAGRADAQPTRADVQSSHGVLEARLRREAPSALTLRAQLGSGAFGAVFEAVHEGKRVAAKAVTVEHGSHVLRGSSEHGFSQQISSDAKDGRLNLIQQQGVDADLLCSSNKRPSNKRATRMSISRRTSSTFLESPLQPREQALRREIRALESVASSGGSEHIVKLFCSLAKFDTVWLIMELCDLSVTDVLDRTGALVEVEVGAVCAGVVRGLDYLHGVLGIVHRDVKGPNILLQASGVVKLGDLGVSTLGASADGDERSSLLKGTPLWMSPEMVACDPYGPPHDVWSTGIAALECAEGAPPHFGIEPPLRALVLIATANAPRLREPGTWSAAFVEFIALCLDKEPARRATTAQLLASPFVAAAVAVGAPPVQAMVVRAKQAGSPRGPLVTAIAARGTPGAPPCAAARCGSAVDLFASWGSSCGAVTPGRALSASGGSEAADSRRLTQPLCLAPLRDDTPPPLLIAGVRCSIILSGRASTPRAPTPRRHSSTHGSPSTQSPQSTQGPKRKRSVRALWRTSAKTSRVSAEACRPSRRWSCLQLARQLPAAAERARQRFAWPRRSCHRNEPSIQDAASRSQSTLLRPESTTTPGVPTLRGWQW